MFSLLKKKNRVRVRVRGIFKRAELFEFGTGHPEKGEDPRMECMLWILDREAGLSASVRCGLGRLWSPQLSLKSPRAFLFAFRSFSLAARGKY